MFLIIAGIFNALPKRRLRGEFVAVEFRHDFQILSARPTAPLAIGTCLISASLIVGGRPVPVINRPCCSQATASFSISCLSYVAVS
jgi:hypothetical protein